MGKIIKRAIEKDKLLNELETNIKSDGRLVCINGYINEEGQMMVILLSMMKLGKFLNWKIKEKYLQLQAYI